MIKVSNDQSFETLHLNNLNYYIDSLPINLSSLCFAAAIIPFRVIFVYLVMFIIEDRLNGYLPTISESGTGRINIDHFCLRMWRDALILFSLLQVYLCYLRQTYSISKIIVFILKLLSWFTLFGTGLLGSFPVTTQHDQHFFFAGFCFISIFIYETISFIIVWKSVSHFRQISYLFIFIICMITFILFLFSSNIFNDRTSITYSSFAEHIYFITLGYGFLTWFRQIQTLDLSLVILNE